MKPTLFACLLAVSVAAVPGVAGAQPSQQPSLAPSSEGDADDISQINGHPIKVGEHNEYHYSFKRWNVSTNPIGLILGFYNVSLSYALTPHVALRGDLNIIHVVGDDDSGTFEAGIGAPIYFKKVYSGFFLEPGVIVRSPVDHRSYHDTYDSSGDASVFGPQMLAGWHWSWDSGLNVAFAFGAGRNMNTGSSDSGSELFANGYFRAGYEF
jgi:hypothetical protein